MFHKDEALIKNTTIFSVEIYLFMNNISAS